MEFQKFTIAKKKLCIVLFFTLIMLFCMENIGHALSKKEIKIENMFLYSTYPEQKSTSGYCTIRNNSKIPIFLISVSSSVSKNVEIHSMDIENNIAKMRSMKEINIQPNTTIELQPGNRLHLMFLDLNRTLKVNDTVSVKLIFKGKSVRKTDVIFPVIDNKKNHHHN